MCIKLKVSLKMQIVFICDKIIVSCLFLFLFKHNAEVAVREMLKEIAANTKVSRKIFFLWNYLRYFPLFMNIQHVMVASIKTVSFWTQLWQVFCLNSGEKSFVSSYM